MLATLEFDMNNPQDVMHFEITTKAQLYLEAFVELGQQLHQLLENEGTVEEAMDIFNEVTNRVGIKIETA